MVQKNLKVITMALLAGMLSTGCTLVGEHKMTGGGTMASAGGDKKATFTFNVERCDGENAKGQVNFVDQTAIDFESVGGVNLRAKIDDFGFCQLTDDLEVGEEVYLCNCGDQFEASFSYESKNPQAPGEGTGFACFLDTGEGKGNFHGMVTAMNLVDGPYDGYTNLGTMNGNIQSHSCPDKNKDEE
ncbi:MULTISPECIES: hypothetical protein [unclassified Pseudoalteromonas]|uniref:hypothetical protein n=1 Tax=unclassified Pseudoalteromonas TaxID=194690 RepID=UPI000CF70C01|nr:MULTISPECIES: hypothetical protein [unclassified Pseudoalteromonas]MBS3796352.1 hypothetical protein [Pseudoalteromonas sp. BDTF-M6]